MEDAEEMRHKLIPKTVTRILMEGLLKPSKYSITV